jgi:hypothetical protein
LTAGKLSGQRWSGFDEFAATQNSILLDVKDVTLQYASRTSLVTVALALIAKVGGGAIGAAICVGITVAIFILGANIPMFSVLPAAVYGYSSVAALALLKPGQDIFSASVVSNPLINIAVSMAIGSVFAFVSEKLVGMLGTEAESPIRA